MERYNVIVIGAGSGGLVVAAGAAGLGARVALVEKGPMGGDCLNAGCVPSKALLAAARARRGSREARRFGLDPIVPGPQEFLPVREYVRSVQARIAPNDSIQRFEGLGVEVLVGAGRLRSAHEVEVGDRVLWGRHIVVATGSRAAVPDLPGLAEAGFLTNESVFDVDALPASLAVVGGGPVGVELGQAFARLGSRVTIVSSSPHVCPREDPEAAAALAASLRREGVTILDGAVAAAVARRGGKKVVAVSTASGGGVEVEADEILVAAGRRPSVEGLGLEAAGVRYSTGGIEIDETCRTNVPSVWAVGDVTGGPFFTHWAGHQARVVVRNVLFPGTARHDLANLPRTTFTDPEIAHVGLGEAEARARGLRFQLFRVGFESVDRAVCDGTADGSFAKVVAGRQGRILGATIVHPNAGELLAELVLAKKHGIGLDGLSGTIHAYPGLSEVNRALGDAYLRTKLTRGFRAGLERAFRWTRS